MTRKILELLLGSALSAALTLGGAYLMSWQTPPVKAKPVVGETGPGFSRIVFSRVQ